MNNPVRIAIVGFGLIGRRHAEAIMTVENARLCAIVDPLPEAKIEAKKLSIPSYLELSEMLSIEKPDGIILATPNLAHLDGTLECLSAGCPVLVEKPIATTAAQAQIMVDAAKAAQLALLVGHHRRYNPLIQKARELVDEGALGDILSVQATCWFYKPDDYFEIAPWRKAKGAGPIAVNLVHDIDLMRYLCGEVEAVLSFAHAASRGFDNEDTAVSILRFSKGALATISVSDSIVSPWSWEMTAAENPAYPVTSQSSYLLGGTRGSMSLPDLTLWNNSGERSWFNPVSATSYPVNHSDPLVNQIQHFAEVIRGEATALVSGEEGMKTLRVIEAIQETAESGQICLL